MRPSSDNRKDVMFSPSRRNAISHKWWRASPSRKDRARDRRRSQSRQPPAAAPAQQTRCPRDQAHRQIVDEVEGTAATTPATHDVACGDTAQRCLGCGPAPTTHRFGSIPQTTTNRPATSGRTPQDMPRIGSGECRAMTSTTTVKDAPVQKSATRAAGRTRMPTVTLRLSWRFRSLGLPPNVSGGASLMAATFASSAGRCVSRNATYVVRSQPMTAR